MLNPNLEYQKYLSILTSVNKRINISVKIRTNYHEVHSEIEHCTIPKAPWKKIIYHLCDTKRVEDEKHFLLEFPRYTQISSQFPNICHNTDIPNLLSHKKFSDLGTLLLMIFKY